MFGVTTEEWRTELALQVFPSAVTYALIRSAKFVQPPVEAVVVVVAIVVVGGVVLVVVVVVVVMVVVVVVVVVVCGVIEVVHGSLR